jgi:hypothetical protein
MKYTGFHGPDSECTFPGYDAVCENLLGLCYEIRHAWQGDRDIEQVYNGIREEWFDDDHTPVRTGDELLDGDEDDHDGTFSRKFSRKDFPDITTHNTYFSIPLGFPEAVFYSLILLEILHKKDVFLQTRKQLAENIDALTELNKQYVYFQANEDIARLTLFTHHVLHTLYRFVGEDKYTAFMEKFGSYPNFFLTSDLDRLNSILEDYERQVVANDDPNHLFEVLMSFFRSSMAAR